MPDQNRHVLLLSLSRPDCVLVDRIKWNSKRILRFDLQEIFSRKETTTLKAMAALLHRDSLAPESGITLLDSHSMKTPTNMLLAFPKI